MKKNKLRYELCIAALLGDKIYNFEYFQEIFKSSSPSSQYNWLYQLLI